VSLRGWRRHFIPPLLPAALAIVVTTGSALAGYQATVDVNETAFDVCDGTPNSTPAKMLNAAVAAYRSLAYSATGYTQGNFTKAHTLARTVNDWGYYVHSHGDYYLNSDGSRYTGFREDALKCPGTVVFSKEIKAKRVGRQSNLLFISTCHASDSNTTMPGAFAIAKTKTVWPNSQGPEFYVGYIGVQFDSDEWIFEQRYWNALGNGNGVGAAFDVAAAGSFGHAEFDADWWGSYVWSGHAGPGSTCPTCS
jgi:hypothetical protein